MSHRFRSTPSDIQKGKENILYFYPPTFLCKQAFYSTSKNEKCLFIINAILQKPSKSNLPKDRYLRMGETLSKNTTSKEKTPKEPTPKKLTWGPITTVVKVITPPRSMPPKPSETMTKKIKALVHHVPHAPPKPTETPVIKKAKSPKADSCRKVKKEICVSMPKCQWVTRNGCKRAELL
jgi:hypothetical protein